MCRWDERGTGEGDATNEQALFFSRDAGATWVLAGDGPILRSGEDTSFAIPSSITHAWIFEDAGGRTWLYHTVNQPFTWGENRPDRSTGGGEIRKREIVWENGTWRVEGPGVVVWGFRQPLPDGRGGRCDDIRTISWNGLVRTRSGRLLMPVGGRSCVKDPQGAFSPLNRVWLLVSHDDGSTWPEAHFVAGGDDLCVAEPTLVETSTGGLVCLLRVQYGTGNQLHRTISSDGGRSWSAPAPTALPQADKQGVKPHLIRLRPGGYALVQTNEHGVIERTNLAIFLTDEKGLLADDWRQVRTLHIGNRQGWWPGSCYGWLAESDDGALLAAFPCHDAEGGHLWFARLDNEYMEHPEAVEPNGVFDERGDHIPRLEGAATPGGERSFVFTNVRGRLVAPSFGLLDRTQAGLVSLQVRIERPPADLPFAALRLTARNGREVVLEILLDQRGWHWRAGGETGLIGIPADGGGWQGILCRIVAERTEVSIGNHLGKADIASRLDHVPTGLQIGGAAAPSACLIEVGEISYAVAEEPTPMTFRNVALPEATS